MLTVTVYVSYFPSDFFLRGRGRIFSFRQLNFRPTRQKSVERCWQPFGEGGGGGRVPTAMVLVGGPALNLYGLI
jgi:hypothetical protein